MARGALAEAEQAFEAGLRLDPAGPGARGAWEAWAECLEAQGKQVEAAWVWGEALTHFPGDPILELSLAAAQIGAGQFAPALDGLARLIDAWPGQRPLLAHLARGLRDVRAFGELARTLDAGLAGDFAGDVEFGALLEACRGWQGQGEGAVAERPTMRELLLGRYGVILLGTGHDDGFAIPWYATYLCSNYDVVATCARLLACAAQFDWRWEGVVAIDRPAQVLAELLGHALERPVLRADAGSEIDPSSTLAVASFLAPGWTTALGPAGALGRRCAEAGNLFAFGALDYTRHELLPPVLGMAAGDRVCLPWWRLGEARIGFSRAGLIDDLPPEVDARPPATIAREYRQPLAEFELGPGARMALRDLHAHRSELGPGLRERSDFARIPARAPRSGEDDANSEQTLLAALSRGSTAEFLRAIGALEQDRARVTAPVLDALEARFRSSPGVRSRLSDLLYAVAPRRFSAALEAMIRQPVEAVPPDQRDGLLHLYGCSPWGTRATGELRRWLGAGVMSNRSEIVQSKYGLHWLCEEQPRAVLDQLFADEPPVVIGTLRWLHDNPHFHGHIAAVEPLLDHDHADVVFEALQCLREAEVPVDGARLEPFLTDPRPRLRSAAVELLELAPFDEALPRALSFIDRALESGRSEVEAEVLWAATRTLIRWRGTDPGSADSRLEARRRGAEEAAARFVARAPLAARGPSPEAKGGGGELGALGREMIRAVASSDDFEVFDAWLRAGASLPRLTALSVLKVFAAAFTPAILALDDPRFLTHLRDHGEAFALDPPRGFASFIARHGRGEAWEREAVLGAQGATTLRAGYEAKAVLARLEGEGGSALAELEAALDYASPYREAALEAYLCDYQAHRDAPDCGRLGAVDPRREPKLGAACWRVLTETLAGPRPAPAPWASALRACLREDWRREARWAAFIEVQLRAQIPSKFVVGATSADFGVLATLLPRPFEALVERTLGGTPDRFAVDLFEWLAAHQRERAAAWIDGLLDSPHWGLRQAARRAQADA